MPQELNFKLNLPVEWNNGTVFIGGGGFDGNVNGDAYSPDILERGYSTISTNHGHDGTPDQGNFALNNEMLNEYAELAVPRVLAPAKAIMRMFYGDQMVAKSKMVYEGCSGGGRQALLQAQRYPNLFDGIIARAPANTFVSQFLYYQNIVNKFNQPGGNLDLGKLALLRDAVLQQCDGLDGLKDNIVSRPDLCNFNIDSLRCTGAETSSCLTGPQIESAKSFYTSTSVAGGKFTWPGFPFGIEVADPPDNPNSWQTLAGPTMQALNDGFIKYFVTRDPNANPATVDLSQYTERLDYLASLINATNPDLSTFAAKGGKLILWHGLSDPLITFNNTVDYYNKLVMNAGGQAKADQFVQFFTAPGVQHCLGGEGADTVDLLGPMFDWLNKGTSPSSQKIVAAQSTPRPGAKPIKRPLCKYPSYAKYNGTGDPSLDTSFTCTSPAEQ
jgi:feruloyl esterase